MGYIKVQTVCLVIIAIAAVKYLLPDIRKLCRMIGGEERKKAEKEPVKETIVNLMEENKELKAKLDKQFNKSAIQKRNEQIELQNKRIPVTCCVT